MDHDVTPRIFLARHGQSIANLQELISGQIDFPLSPKGQDQALCLRDVLWQRHLDAIYASSLSRAVETARPTAEHRPLEIQTMDGLREINFGVLQGRTIDDSDPHARDIWRERSSAKSTYRIPGGEVFAEFESRVNACLDQVLDNLSGAALIVAHRNTNEVILARLLALGCAADLDINVKNKYLYEIELTDTPQVTTIRLGGERHGQKYQGLKVD
jgi:broad specificity phosphatase PhoE